MIFVHVLQNSGAIFDFLTGIQTQGNVYKRFGACFSVECICHIILHVLNEIIYLPLIVCHRCMSIHDQYRRPKQFQTFYSSQRRTLQECAYKCPSKKSRCLRSQLTAYLVYKIFVCRKSIVASLMIMPWNVF